MAADTGTATARTALAHVMRAQIAENILTAYDAVDTARNTIRDFDLAQLGYTDEEQREITAAVTCAYADLFRARVNAEARS